MSNEQRKQFEANFLACSPMSLPSDFTRDSVGGYENDYLEQRWRGWVEGQRARDAEVQALERVALNVMASLDAALSILGRSHEGKVPANEAVASDRMFTMMLDDYQKSLDAARAALAGGETGEAE